jgi:hypothetical protein
LNSFWEAPTTATVFGLNNASNIPYPPCEISNL